MDALSANELDPRRRAARNGRMAVPEDRGNGRRQQTEEADEESSQFLSIETLRRQYTDYLTNKVDEIEEQKEARRYYHGAFYTAEQLRVLKDRHQPPLPFNRTCYKINARVGLIQGRRSDPKAVGKNPQGEQGAEIATQSIRTVLSDNEFKSQEWWCLLQSGIDGISGVQLVLKQLKDGNHKIVIDWVIADEYFYDPNSYRWDFRDKTYEGISKWFKIDVAVGLFPEKEELLRSMLNAGSDLTTNPDREIKWTMTTAQKIRIVEHWYLRKGKWCWAFYTGTDLLDQGVSPFVNDDGDSESAFHMFAQMVDQDGDRYGWVRNIKGPQDALNAGKSKFLHLANSQTVRSTKGVVDDVQTARQEISRPDGWIEENPIPNGKLEILDKSKDLAAFAGFIDAAEKELDRGAEANLSALSGNALGNISGRAIELLRQPGMAELGPVILSWRAWKLRLFRGIWNAAQRYWTKEMWLRVNNDGQLAQFIQLNGLGLDQFGRPAIVNAVGHLAVNIELEEGPDIATLMQDTYDALKGYPPGTFPPQVLIELNPNIPRSEKNRILQMMAPKPQPPTPEQQILQRLALEEAAGKVAKTAADVRKTHAQAEQATATAREKLEGVVDEDQRLDLAAREFARDTLVQAAQAAQPPQAPGAQGNGQVRAPGPASSPDTAMRAAALMRSFVQPPPIGP